MALSSATKRLGKLLPASTVLFVCDVQEVFRGRIFQLPTVIHSTNSMVSAAKILDLPVLVTTQYAARLGNTMSEIAENLADAKDVKIFDKTLFSMVTPEVEDYLKGPTMQARKSVLLCGIETHVCVLQTALDLLDRGYDVHILADAVSSSTSFTRSVALERLRQSGAFVTSVESAIFQLANDSKAPGFRNISALIKEHLKVNNGFEASDSRL